MIVIAIFAHGVVPMEAKDPANNTTTQTYTVPVASGTARALTYDLNGNLTDNGAGQTYQWDAANRLTRITYTGGARTEFAYNGLGQRAKIIEKNSGGSVTSEKRFLWCDGPQPCEERDGSNNVTKRFYAGLGEEISGTPYYYTTDHLGSVREMTNSSGVIQARYDSDPYGRITKVSGSLEADFGFTGFYRHQTSGLNLTLYRVYDSDTSRWLSRDIIEESGGINLYGYVDNNPVIWSDDLGLAAGPDPTFAKLLNTGSAEQIAKAKADFTKQLAKIERFLTDPARSEASKKALLGNRDLMKQRLAQIEQKGNLRDSNPYTTGDEALQVLILLGGEKLSPDSQCVSNDNGGDKYSGSGGILIYRGVTYISYHGILRRAQ